MYKFLFWLVFLFGAIKAQDTLYFKNLTKVVVILKEISETEIKYKRFEMPDGPEFTVNKTDIEKIIYKNGIVENILLPVGKDATVVLQRMHIDYHASKKNIRELILYVEKHPNINKQKTLTEYVYSINRLKRASRGVGVATIVCGGLTAVTGFFTGIYYILTISGSGHNYPNFLLPVATISAITFGGLGTTIALDVNLKKKRKAFVNLYNE